MPKIVRVDAPSMKKKKAKKMLQAPDGKFLPGTRGGPGRPKGSVSLRTELRLLLSELVRITKGDRRLIKSKARLLMETLYDVAMGGDTRALQLAMEHVDGKPTISVVDLTPTNRLEGVSDEKLDRIINGKRHATPALPLEDESDEPSEPRAPSEKE